LKLNNPQLLHRQFRQFRQLFQNLHRHHHQQLLNIEVKMGGHTEHYWLKHCEI
jgi:hypothetical protein